MTHDLFVGVTEMVSVIDGMTIRCLLAFFITWAQDIHRAELMPITRLPHSGHGLYLSGLAIFIGGQFLPYAFLASHDLWCNPRIKDGDSIRLALNNAPHLNERIAVLLFEVLVGMHLLHGIESSDFTGQLVCATTCSAFC